MTKALPPRPNLEQLRKQAKLLQKKNKLRTLAEAQHAIAREYGFENWAALKKKVSENQPSPPREDLVIALRNAARRGDAVRLTALLDAHPELLNERGGDGTRTALHDAAGQGREDVVKLLLDRGADPNIRCEGDSAFPLHFAAEKGHFGIIRLLIEHGADPIGTDDYHELEVIGWATSWDYIQPRKEIVDYLLAHGATHNIFSAVSMGAIDAIRKLVAANPSLLERRMDLGNRRRRPLHLAVVKKQPDALAALLELGANPESLDTSAFTALDEAGMRGELEMARILIDRGAQIRLPAAVGLGRTREMEALLRRDPDCLQPGHRWGNLIVRAAEHSTGKVIESLLRAGAFVNVHDDPKTAVDLASGFTPLHAAAASGNKEAGAVLLRNGADVRAREDRWRGSPAGWANYLGHPEVRDLILDEGKIDILDAIELGRPQRIREIVSREPEVLNKPYREYRLYPMDAEEWYTPLAHAALSGNFEAVRILLKLGADPDIKAPGGRSIRVLAQERNQTEIAKLLLKREEMIMRAKEIRAGTQISEFEKEAEELAADGRTLDEAQSRVARLHGFATWTNLSAYVAGLQRLDSQIARYERAVDAIVAGDIETLSLLLTADPELVRTRSLRAHNSTLLHYVAANGVEDFRQKTPPNIVAVTKLIIDSGAEVDAENNPGRGTTLGLAATSIHPVNAGVQIALLETLLAAGASPDGLARGWNPLIASLANGRGPAAEYLASRGARLDLEGASGVGSLDVVRTFFDDQGRLTALATQAQMENGLLWACEYGQKDVVEFLLARGVDPAVKHRATALHFAAYAGYPDIVRLLLAHKAPVDVRDESFDGTPLGWALHGWGDPPPGQTKEPYYAVVAMLIRAGSPVNIEDAKEVAAEDPHMLRALEG